MVWAQFSVNWGHSESHDARRQQKATLISSPFYEQQSQACYINSSAHPPQCFGSCFMSVPTMSGILKNIFSHKPHPKGNINISCVYNCIHCTLSIFLTGQNWCSLALHIWFMTERLSHRLASSSISCDLWCSLTVSVLLVPSAVKHSNITMFPSASHLLSWYRTEAW